MALYTALQLVEDDCSLTTVHDENEPGSDDTDSHHWEAEESEFVEKSFHVACFFKINLL